MKIFRKWRVLTLGGILCFATVGHAQEAQSEIEHSRQLLRGQMELKLQEMEVITGGDVSEDLGEQILVRRKPQPWTLTLAADAGGLWTSNVFLVDGGPTSDFALAHNDSATFTYKFTDEFSFSSNYRFTRFRYKRLIIQDFDSHNVGGTFNYTLPYQINLYTGLQWTGIHSRPVNDFVYDEVDWTIGANKVFPLDFADWMKDRAAWFVGYQTDVRVASPNDFDKVEVSPYTGFSYLVNPKMTLQTFYRWQYQHFQKGGRKDYNNSVTSTLTWSPFEWMSLSAFCGYTYNNSVGTTRDYAVFNTGSTLRFSWKF